MREDLKEVLRNVLEIDIIRDTDSVETVAHWDSVRHLSLVMALEEKYGITFDAGEIPELTSVGKIAEALDSRGLKTGAPR